MVFFNIVLFKTQFACLSASTKGTYTKYCSQRGEKADEKAIIEKPSLGRIDAREHGIIAQLWGKEYPSRL